MYSGEQIQTSLTKKLIQDLKIDDRSTLFLAARLRGGV